MGGHTDNKDIDPDDTNQGKTHAGKSVPMKGIADKSKREDTEKCQEAIQMKGTTNPLYTAVHERRASVRPQPKNSILYEVKESDTITNVAARFHTTPSELVNLNRLISRVLFPGQIIYVPDSGEASSFLKSLKDGKTHTQKNTKLINDIQLLLHKRPSEDDSERSPSALAENLDKESTQKFLKINVKHITDGEGVVSGVLLVTPNHVMFDPNVSDPLVMEHGSSKYGVVAPLYMVVRIAIYPDIVRMKIKDPCVASTLDHSIQLYHSKTKSMKKSSSHDSSFDSEQPSEGKKSENVTGEKSEADVHPPLLSKISEGLESSQSAESRAEEEKTESLQTQQSTESDSFAFVNESDVPPLAIESSVKEATDQHSDDALKKKTSFEKTKERLQKGLRRLSVSESIFPTNIHRRMSLPVLSSVIPQEGKNKVSLKKAKSKEIKQKESPSTLYTNMVEDKPELFVTLDKLIPRPAKSFDDNPLYLCLQMGKPLKPSVHNRFNPVVDFGHKVKSEYWFSIPRERVDNLYFFILRWAPEKYGDIDNVDMEELGFEPIDDNEDERESRLHSITDSVLSQVPNISDRRATWAFPWRLRKSHTEDSSKEWEYVQRDECVKEPSIAESEITLPDLTCESSILTETHLRKLNDVLPARAVGYSWELVYSTAINGFSLKTLYREMQNYDSPVFIIVANTTGAIFGAMLSCPLRLSDHFYGTGESFLFTFYPEFKYFPWSGENNYFIKGNTSSFAIGASDGQFGLWLDDDLFHGCTKECRTFNNDCLSDSEDFIVKTVEAWGFV